ncbi:MAG TPA: glutamate racemase [Anaerolineaceae bacterium]|nr:glutamate racemase [Anaerolineaceae bacterium]HOU42997.1 glutamate racemase [Anaerolineaceae bacterium]HPA31993.1 glutamate racemase [Anaerolineaceae bacterium]HQF44490.1 glutamate racemase [Anaerolineaceae bacterium]HQJ02514.1 glutamate racemase [Anaerolineaceae bacterium]
MQQPVPVGIFDSGVGGLSVLRAVREFMPEQDILYLADQAHVPYGPRPLLQVREFAEGITRFLLDRGARLIVVACNAASAASLHYLRNTFPDVPFVGMEPAVKPAAEQTRSGVVGVLATPATFQGALYASVLERFARDVTVLQDTCPGLVAEVESGNLEGDAVREILTNALSPMLQAGIDTVVLGCTHYPFVIPLIQEIAGPGVRVIDPAPAIARQTRRLLSQNGWGLNGTGSIQCFTTGPVESMKLLVKQLLGDDLPVEHATWEGGVLSGNSRQSSH